MRLCICIQIYHFLTNYAAPETKEALDEVLGGVEVEKPQSITQDDGKTLWAVKVNTYMHVHECVLSLQKVCLAYKE